MGKPSRRQRKVLRDKRDHAESHGLPVGRVSLPKASAIAVSAGAVEDGSATLVSADPAGESTPSSPPTGHGWSSWPLSVKLLVVGILALVAIGLFRRYSEDKGVVGAGASDTMEGIDAGASAAKTSGVPGHEAPNASATLLAEPANSAN